MIFFFLCTTTATFPAERHVSKVRSIHRTRTGTVQYPSIQVTGPYVKIRQSEVILFRRRIAVIIIIITTIILFYTCISKQNVIAFKQKYYKAMHHPFDNKQRIINNK